jgi:hypothetical protein
MCDKSQDNFSTLTMVATVGVLRKEKDPLSIRRQCRLTAPELRRLPNSKKKKKLKPSHGSFVPTPQLLQVTRAGKNRLLKIVKNSR